MKIKRKVQKNLPQLIEWAWENPDLSHGMTFISNGCERVQINFKYNPRGVLNLDILNGINISNDIQFTLEELEEITEDTELDLIERFIVNNKTYYTNPQKMSINTCLGAAPDDIIITHFYIETDNRELILIWRDGKLVE